MSVGDKDISVAHHESTTTSKAKKGHCKRFWWIYVIVLVLIVVIVVPVILLVAVPKIAQDKLNAAELQIDSIVISQTKPNSYNMAVNSVITSDGKVHATIEPFLGAMYLEDLPAHTPFVYLQFPETTSDAFQIVNVSQPVQIPDMAAFTTFNTWLQNNKTLRVTIEGDTNVHVKGISRAYPVKFKKTLTMNGLNGFSGLKVTEAHISLTPDANGNNFKGTVQIPNYSHLSIDIGNATFRNFLDGNEIGTVYMDNLLLVPGNNTVPMRATIQQVPVINAVRQRPACESGFLTFQLQGKDVVHSGERISYFADALASGNQTVAINIAGALKADLNVTIECAA